LTGLLAGTVSAQSCCEDSDSGGSGSSSGSCGSCAGGGDTWGFLLQLVIIALFVAILITLFYVAGKLKKKKKE
jgi:hypothetical protein